MGFMWFSLLGESFEREDLLSYRTLALINSVTLWASITWLLLRAFMVLRKPRSELMDVLGLTRMVKPVVVVESLGDSYASIYWYYPVPSVGQRRPKSRRHVLRVGNRVIETERDQRKVLVEGLEPDTTYTVVVQALQGSHTTVLHPVYNPHGSEEVAPLAVNASNDGVSDAVSSTCYFHTLTSSRDTVPSRETLLQGVCITPPENGASQGQSISRFQAETKSVLDQHEAWEDEFDAKYKALLQELQTLNDERKQDELERTQLRGETKVLEDQKHALEVQVSKLKLRAAKVAKYKSESEELQQSTSDIAYQHKVKKADHDRTLDELTEKLRKAEERETWLAQKIKEVTRSLRLMEQQTEEVKACINKLKNLASSSLSEKLEVIKRDGAEVLGAENARAIENELQLDSRIEREWARAQESLEQQYVEGYLRNSERQAQLQIQEQAQAQAQAQQVQAQVQAQAQQAQASSLHGNLGPPATVPSETSRPASLLNVGISPYGSMTPLSSLPLQQNASLTSLQTASTLSSIQPPISAVPSPQPMTGLQFGPHGSSPSLGLPHSFQGYPFAPQATTALHEGHLSPTVADNLLPSNLFQDSEISSGYEPIYAPSTPNTKVPSATMSSVSADDSDRSFLDGGNDVQMTKGERSPAPSKDSTLLPWFSPSSSSRIGHQRTTSLFFGSHAPPTPGGSNSEAAPDLPDAPPVPPVPAPPAASEPEREFSEGEAASPGKSPLKGMGTRLFHKSHNHHHSTNNKGNFVRRLSIFSKKDVDVSEPVLPHPTAQPSSQDEEVISGNS